MNEPVTQPPPARKRVLPTIGRALLLLLLAFSTFAFLVAGLSPESASDVRKTQSDEDSPTKVAVSQTAFSQTGPRSTEGPDSSETLELARTIQFQWQALLDEQSLEAAPLADWRTVCRRLSLALVGTGMSLEETRLLEQLPESERISTHRDRLLASDRFHRYWAERTTRYLVGADEGPFLVFRRRRFHTWLAKQYAANIRYDALVRQLITAKGVWTDRPEVNFYTVTFDSGENDPDPIRLAARATRAFLGVRIDCLQCHDDFLGNVSLGDIADDETTGTVRDVILREGTQEDFHSLAAFFTAATSEGLQGLRDKRAKYEYQYLDEVETVSVDPNVPFERDLLPPRQSGLVKSVDAESDASNPADEGDAAPRLSDRERLAIWLTHPDNKQSARAAVVRVWTLLFGQPPAQFEDGSFRVREVDDLPLDAPSLPLIETLADAFIANDFDTRALIQWITDSPPFRISSQADFEITARHEHAMAAFPIVRLRSEQVAGATIQAGRIKTINRDSSFLVQLQQFGDTNDFLKRYGDLGEDEFSNQPVTITQRLVMLNGKLVKEMSNPNPIMNASSHIAMFAQDDADVVRTLYLTVLNRTPSEAELQHFVSRLEDSDSTRGKAIADLTWVLFNSSEFAWNH